MKRIACRSCGSLVPLAEHPGILVNAIARAGSRVVEMEERLASLGDGAKKAERRAQLEVGLAKAREELKHLIGFRDDTSAEDLSCVPSP